MPITESERRELQAIQNAFRPPKHPYVDRLEREADPDYKQLMHLRRARRAVDSKLDTAATAQREEARYRQLLMRQQEQMRQAMMTPDQQFQYQQQQRQFQEQRRSSQDADRRAAAGQQATQNRWLHDKMQGIDKQRMEIQQRIGKEISQTQGAAMMAQLDAQERKLYESPYKPQDPPDFNAELNGGNVLGLREFPNGTTVGVIKEPGGHTWQLDMSKGFNPNAPAEGEDPNAGPEFAANEVKRRSGVRQEQLKMQQAERLEDEQNRSWRVKRMQEALAFVTKAWDDGEYTVQPDEMKGEVLEKVKNRWDWDKLVQYASEMFGVDPAMLQAGGPKRPTGQAPQPGPEAGSEDRYPPKVRQQFTEPEKATWDKFYKEELRLAKMKTMPPMIGTGMAPRNVERDSRSVEAIAFDNTTKRMDAYLRKPLQYSVFAPTEDRPKGGAQIGATSYDFRNAEDRVAFVTDANKNWAIKTAPTGILNKVIELIQAEPNLYKDKL